MSTLAAPATLCMARHVPERCDDIFWENDRIAHRIYGPDLLTNPKGPPMSSSGIDVWVKKVRHPFMNNALAINDYHNDHGEGMDCFDTGTTRGCGGLGVWNESTGTLCVSSNWARHGILANGPALASFWVEYDPWSIGDRRTVRERRTFALPAGTNFTRMTSTLTATSGADLLVGIGLTRRTPDGKKFAGEDHLHTDAQRGLMSYWEPEQLGKGTTGTAIRFNPASFVRFLSLPEQHLVLLRANSGTPFIYHAGACWTGGLDFHSRREWQTYATDLPLDFTP